MSDKQLDLDAIRAHLGVTWALPTNQISSVSRFGRARIDCTALADEVERLLALTEQYDLRYLYAAQERAQKADSALLVSNYENARLRDEVERLTAHSIRLNSISWRIAEAVGKVPEGADKIESDTEDDLTNLVNQEAFMRSQVNRLEDDLLRVMGERNTALGVIEQVRALTNRSKAGAAYNPFIGEYGASAVSHAKILAILDSVNGENSE